MSKMKHVLKVVGEPTFIHHEATEKHGEVTIAIVTYGLKMVTDYNCVPEEVQRKIYTISKSIPECKLNKDYGDCDYLFTVKGKTVRSKNDEHNQVLADKIALAKCNVKACKLSRRLLSILYDYYRESCLHLGNSISSIIGYEEREKKYIQKM